MTFKQFRKWCNDRCCDGCWSFNIATMFISFMEDVYKRSFWKREKYFQKLLEDGSIESLIKNLDEQRMKQSEVSEW